jgi:ferrous iron transport protein A
MNVPSVHPLASLPPGTWATVQGLRAADDERRWLRAIGLFEGQRVTVLRRAPWGGPLHVRVSSGGEFAVDRAIAAEIDVDVVNAEGAR